MMQSLTDRSLFSLFSRPGWWDVYRLLLDVSLFGLAYVVAFLLRFDGHIPPPYLATLLASLPLVIGARTLAFWWFSLFRGVWRYVSAADLLALGKAVVVGSAVIVGGIYLVHGFPGFPRSVFVIDAVLVALLTGSARLTRRLATTGALSFRRLASLERNRVRRVLVVGAGDAGESLLRDMQRARNGRYHPVGFADDDRSKQGKHIRGVLVAGGVADVPSLVERHAVEEILVAIPSASSTQMQRIVRYCREAGRPVRSVPAVGETDPMQGVYLHQLREVRLEDLFGRPAVALDLREVAEAVRGRRVLVTGAGGSIGSELCHQVAGFHPEELIQFEKGENALFYLHRNLSVLGGLEAAEYRTPDPGLGTGHHRTPRIIPILGDLTNREHIARVVAVHRPDFVFHAAAHKHVPLTEVNPAEAVRNNIGGTRNLVTVCGEEGVGTLVFLSTDKAANPISVLGLTKRLGEAYVSAAAAQYRGRFMSVRFGNVLESSGSVVRLFREQLRQGKPLTVTHPDAKRYFMAKSEAVQLVLQAAVLGRGGEIYVLAMGEPVRITDVARELIVLNGLAPDGEPGIVFTGLRPGEKLVEELVGRKEEATATSHPKILSLRAQPPEWGRVDQECQTLLWGVAAGVDPERLCARLRVACEEIERWAGAPSSQIAHSPVSQHRATPLGDAP